MEQSNANSTIYKQLSADMREGLKNIYQQISTASADKTDALFNEATDELKEVVKATENAAMSIMDIVEAQLEKTGQAAAAIKKLQEKYGNDPILQELEKNNTSLEQDLTTVLTNLSFQDIAGQRIKKVLNALGIIEHNVVDLYLSSGLIMDGAEKNPSKDAETLQKEAQQAMQDFHENRQVSSELKGPSKDAVSQGAIDDMLAQLGL